MCLSPGLMLWRSYHVLRPQGCAGAFLPRAQARSNLPRLGEVGGAFGAEFAGALGNQPRGRALDVALEPGEKGLAIETGQDRVEDFHPHRAGKAQEAPARPE